MDGSDLYQDLYCDVDKADNTTILGEGHILEVHHKVFKLASRYYEFGLALHIHSSKLDEIRANHPNNVGRVLVEVLLEWLRQNYDVKRYGNPTWRMLAQAVDIPSGGADHRLALEIAAEHRSCEQGTALSQCIPHRRSIMSHSRVLNVAALIACCGVLLACGVYTFSHHLISGSLSSGQTSSSTVRSLPYLSHEQFFGRKQEIIDLLHHLDFDNKATRIISLVGSPGFGKSTLAIHVGHKMLANGTRVHYINLADFPDENVKHVLAQKIFESAGIPTNTTVTFDQLLKWLQRSYSSFINFGCHVLIFDNCDQVLHSQREGFHEAIDRIVESSEWNIKVLMTSRERPLRANPYFYEYKIEELDTQAAHDLLDYKLNNELVLNGTEIGIITNVTGNIPLALQIIGSLLRSPMSPTKDEVITELQNDPIQTLSPKRLPANERVNTSFSLSYKYLSDEQRKVAHYLAKFPGSFQQEAALWVYRMYHQISLQVKNPEGEISAKQQKIKHVLLILVEMSLLDYNRQIGFYQFHPLVKEYLLEIEELQKETMEHNWRKFSIGFKFYYNYRLEVSTDKFNEQYKVALTELEVNRHNYRKLLDVLTSNNISSVKVNLDALATVLNAINVGYLGSRFTDEELIHCLENSANHLYINFYHSEITKSDPWLVTVYISLVSSLAKIQERLYNSSIAMKTYQHHHVVVQLLTPPSECHSWKKVYTKFYTKLASYYEKLQPDQHPEIIECHRRVLDQLEQYKATCEQDLCEYRHLGDTYNSIRKLDDAIRFWERSLEFESHTALLEIHLRLKLSSSYKLVGDSGKSEEMLHKILSMYSSVVDIPASQLFNNRGTVDDVIRLFRDNGQKAGAALLEERLIEVIRDISPNDNDNFPWDILLNVLHHYSEERNYSRVVTLGADIVAQEHRNKNLTHTQLKILLIVGKAKYHLGNGSGGLDNIEFVLKYILDHQLQHQDRYAEELKDSCWYLFMGWRLTFFRTCYGNTTYKLLATAVLLPIRVVFHLPRPLDGTPIVDTLSDTSQDQYQSSHVLVEVRHFPVLPESMSNIIHGTVDLISTRLVKPFLMSARLVLSTRCVITLQFMLSVGVVSTRLFYIYLCFKNWKLGGTVIFKNLSIVMIIACLTRFTLLQILVAIALAPTYLWPVIVIIFDLVIPLVFYTRFFIQCDAQMKEHIQLYAFVYLFNGSLFLSC